MTSLGTPTMTIFINVVWFVKFMKEFVVAFKATLLQGVAMR